MPRLSERTGRRVRCCVGACVGCNDVVISVPCCAPNRQRCVVHRLRGFSLSHNGRFACLSRVLDAGSGIRTFWCGGYTVRISERFTCCLSRCVVIFLSFSRSRRNSYLFTSLCHISILFDVRCTIHCSRKAGSEGRGRETRGFAKPILTFVTYKEVWRERSGFSWLLIGSSGGILCVW